MKMVTETITLKDSHCEVGLLWCRFSFGLLDNSMILVERLNGLEGFSWDKNSLSAMQVQQGSILTWITKIKSTKKRKERTASKGSICRITPSQNLKCPKSMCVAFDSAEKLRGYSLNGNLLQGPDSAISLRSAPSRSRKNLFASAGAVKKCSCRFDCQWE